LSGNQNQSQDGFTIGLPPVVQTRALWNWNTTTDWPTVTAYANGQPTKTGILPQDVKDYIGVPMVIYPPNGGAGTPVSDTMILKWIRWAEDRIEQDTGILLTQTWVAAGASKVPESTMSLGISPENGKTQQLGVDYDMEEAPYDFDFARAEDSGWMWQQMRWKPLKGPSPNSPNAIKNYAFIYPLLNSYYRVSASWFVTDPDFGLLRLVPATNIQMLPLFALQLTFQGFADSVPGGIWMQYCAGLSPTDYNTGYSFMTPLVLNAVAVMALGILQGSINFGAVSVETTVDGLAQKIAWNKNGAYSGLITTFDNERKALLKLAKDKVGGVIYTPL